MKYIIRFLLFWRVTLMNLAFAQVFIVIPFFFTINYLHCFDVVLADISAFCVAMSLVVFASTFGGWHTWDTYKRCIILLSYHNTYAYKKIDPTMYCNKVGKHVAGLDFYRLDIKKWKYIFE